MKKIIAILLSLLMAANFVVAGAEETAPESEIVKSYISIEDGSYDRYPTWKGSGAYFYVTRSAAYKEGAVARCGFLKFDLSDIRETLANDYEIAEAVVELTVYTSTDAEDQKISLYKYDDDSWSESESNGPEPLFGTSLNDVNSNIVSKDPENPENNYVIIKPGVTKDDVDHPTYALDITDHLVSELEKEDDNLLSFEANCRTTGVSSKTYLFYTKDYSGKDAWKPNLTVKYKQKEYKDAICGVTVNNGDGGLTEGINTIDVDLESWDSASHEAVLFGALYKKSTDGSEIMTDITAVEISELTSDDYVYETLEFDVPSDGEYFARLWVADGLLNHNVYSSEVIIDSESAVFSGSEGVRNKVSIESSSAEVDRQNGGVSIMADAPGVNKNFGVMVFDRDFNPEELTASSLAENVIYAGAIAPKSEKLSLTFKPADEDIMYEDMKALITNPCVADADELTFTYYLDTLPGQVFELMKDVADDVALADLLDTYSSLIGIKKYEGIESDFMASELYPVDDEDLESFSMRYTKLAAVTKFNSIEDESEVMELFMGFADSVGMDEKLKNTILNPECPEFALEGFAGIIADGGFTVEKLDEELNNAVIEALITNASKYAELMAAFEDTDMLDGYFEEAFDDSRYSKLDSKTDFYKELIDLPLGSAEDIADSIVSAAATVYKEENKSSGGGGGGGSSSKKSAGIIMAPTVVPPVAEPTSPTPVAPLDKPSFTDVSEDMWMYKYVSELCSKGIISGYADSTFRPDSSITREEFAKIICVAANVESADEALSFADVESGRWSYGYIASLVKAGVINGVSENSFAPEAQITRQDASVICMRILGNPKAEGKKTFADENQIADYAVDAVDVLSSLGILTGDESGNFNPGKTLSRAEACALISRLLENI